MLNNEFPPLGGGMGTVNMALLKQFSNEPGLEIDLVTSALGRDYEEEQFSERIRIYKVPVNNRNIHHSSNRELITYSLRGYRQARRLHKENPYDLGFAWSGVPAGGVAYALKRMDGLDYIVRVSGPDIPGFEHRYKYIYPFLTPIIKAIWHNARFVIVKCNEELDMIRELDNGVNLKIIPNGVDLENFYPGERFFDEDPLRLVCVGRLIERKGQNHLIKAVKILTDKDIDVQLDLVGEGDARQDYEELAERLGVADRVHFLGYVPRNKIANHYKSAHVFVLPSYNEGMSVATLEAMAAGLPLLLTRTGGSLDFVHEGENGFTFEYGDIKKLSSHIDFFSKHRTQASRMGAVSRKYAEAFSWESVANSYRDLLMDVC